MSQWRREGKQFSLYVEVPANTTAGIIIPAINETAITESDKPVATARGVIAVKMVGNQASVVVGSGRYAFSSTMP
jgi:alpha-L-rhamnosidase